MNLEEMSEATGMPQNTVKTHLHRSITTMRKRLKETV
jgi:DNA-directed RNA polymerase specialized sigma24 family protein